MIFIILESCKEVGMSSNRRIIQRYDATKIVGLKTIVLDSAVEINDDGENYIEIQDRRELCKVAAMARCLMPVSLEGKEIQSIRKIAGWSATELAQKMGENTSASTVSRWENGHQNIGGYAEKIFRLLVCEHLKNDCPGVNYESSSIAGLRVISASRVSKETNGKLDIPAVIVGRVKVKVDGKSSVDAWESSYQQAA